MQVNVCFHVTSFCMKVAWSCVQSPHPFVDVRLSDITDSGEMFDVSDQANSARGRYREATCEL
jgi:hypothetical protein